MIDVIVTTGYNDEASRITSLEALVHISLTFEVGMIFSDEMIDNYKDEVKKEFLKTVENHILTSLNKDMSNITVYWPKSLKEEEQ